MSPRIPLIHPAWGYDPSGNFSLCFKILSVLARTEVVSAWDNSVSASSCDVTPVPYGPRPVPSGGGGGPQPHPGRQSRGLYRQPGVRICASFPVYLPHRNKCKYVFKKTNCRELAGDQVSCLCHCVSSCRACGSITKTTTFQRRSIRFPWRTEQQLDPAASKVCLALDKHLLPHTALTSFSKVLITEAKRPHD